MTFSPFRTFLSLVCREAEVELGRRRLKTSGTEWLERGHGANARGGVLRARGGTRGAPRAPAVTLEGLFGEQGLKGTTGTTLRTHQLEMQHGAITSCQSVLRLFFTF